MNPKLIIFDFDGTLADTAATILQTFRMTIKALEAENRSDAECRATIGLPLKESFHQLYPSFPDERLDLCVSTYRRIFNENKKILIPELYPGVKESLAELAAREIRMSIASSRSRESLMEFCSIHGISNYFDLILGADDVCHAKPDPEPVIISLKRLGANCDETLVVGDMPVDIKMGTGAGCATVGVTYGNASREELIEAGATYLIDSFNEILETILSKEN